ncbi:hypothetical protein KAU11_03350, partial [Candidatus Babeliales bacterium]|nr:hypothetical protein [Candidatus Babeliales bacterium]
MLSKIIHIIPLIIFTTLATCKIEAGWLDSFDIFAKKSHQISLECDRKLNDFRKKSMTNIGKTLLGAIWSSIKKEEPSTEDGLDNLFEKEEIKDVDACEKTIKEQQKKLDLLKQKTLPQTKKDLKMGIGEFRTKVIKPTISKWEKKKKD